MVIAGNTVEGVEEFLYNSTLFSRYLSDPIQTETDALYWRLQPCTRVVDRWNGLQQRLIDSATVNMHSRMDCGERETTR